MSQAQRIWKKMIELEEKIERKSPEAQKEARKDFKKKILEKYYKSTEHNERVKQYGK